MEGGGDRKDRVIEGEGRDRGGERKEGEGGYSIWGAKEGGGA